MGFVKVGVRVCRAREMLVLNARRTRKLICAFEVRRDELCLVLTELWAIDGSIAHKRRR